MTVQQLGSEFLVNTTTEGLQGNPAIATLADGNFVVAWVDYSGPLGENEDPELRAQIFSPDGAKIGDEFLVNTTTEGSQYVDGSCYVTALANGNFVIAWTDDQGAGGDLKAQIFSGDGSKVGDEFVATTTTDGFQNAAAVTTLADGNFVVTFNDDSGTGGDDGPSLKGQIFSPDGVKIGDEFLVNTATEGAQAESSVTALADGDFVVVWLDYNEGSNGRLKAQIFSSSGDKIGSEFLVSTPTEFQQYNASIAALSNGNFVVTWTGDLAGDGGGEILGQIFSADGTKIGTEFVINTITDSFQGGSSVTALDDGGFVVTWDSLISEGPADWDVKAQLFDNSGTKIGSEFLVNTTTESVQGDSFVAAIGDGKFVVTWDDDSGLGSDTDQGGVIAQIFTTDATPPDAPVIASFADDTGTIGDGITSDHDLLLTGTAEAGSTVTIYDGATQLGTTVADDDGDWTFSTGALDEGGHTFTATATDASQNISPTSDALDVTIEPESLTLYATTGIDNLIGGDFDDSFIFANGTANAGDSFDGGSGQDSLVVAASNSVDFRGVGKSFISVEKLALQSGAAATFSFAQLDGSSGALPSNLSIGGSDGSEQIYIVAESPGTLDLSGWTFTDWTSGLDTIAITGASGADTITGSSEADTIVGFVGADTVNGGAGLDTILLSGTSLTLNSASDARIVGIETISAAGAADKVTINLANQTEGFTIVGSAFADKLTGGSGADIFVGFAGADLVTGGSGFDTIKLTATSADLNVASDAKIVGIEAVTAAAAAAGVTISLVNQTEALSITGSGFADVLKGGSNGDTIVAADGDDLVTGGGGADTLTGGLGADHFIFAKHADSSVTAMDTITDFTQYADLIDLAAFALTNHNVADVVVGGFQGNSAVSNFFVSGSVTYSVVAQHFGGATQIYVDVNHNQNFNPGADLVIHLNTNFALTSADFLF